MKINVQKFGWSKRYQNALRKHLEQGAGASLRTAVRMGREAVALGLETLDLARIHEQALAAVISPQDVSGTRERKTRRAGKFFDEAAIRIEKTHRAVRDADVLIQQLNQTLHQRTRESSASNHRLKQTILHRRTAESTLKKSETNHARLLADSQCLLKHLRRLAHEGLSAHEDHRQDLSRQLHDEIAQGLLGIHVRLLTLQKAVKSSVENFRKEIGSTQELVRESTRKVNRFAHEFGIKNKV